MEKSGKKYESMKKKEVPTAALAAGAYQWMNYVTNLHL